MEKRRKNAVKKYLQQSVLRDRIVDEIPLLFLQEFPPIFHYYTYFTTTRLIKYWASLVAQLVKNLPSMQETQVRSLGGEDPLEKGMVTHSSTLAWRIPWTEELGRPQSVASQRVGHDWVTGEWVVVNHHHTYFMAEKEHLHIRIKSENFSN